MENITPAVPSTPNDRQAPLDVLAHLAVEAGAGRIADEARSLAGRLREGLFFVACVGQFKRGKSSLLNALVGEAVLPVGVAPVTAVVTMVRHGSRTTARVRFADGDWRAITPSDLPDYVTEDRNPENGKGIVAVEVFVPSPLLDEGMCLVDTPGIGSVFTGNTEATRAFVPHIDAALVVLGADPPISADEIALVEEIGKQCQDVLFVMNKADRLPDPERAVAVDFTRRVLSKRFAGRYLPIFETSATEKLARAGPPRGWPALVGALGKLARESGTALVREAGRRGVALLADRLRHQLDEERQALLRPVEESEGRVEVLRAAVTEAERSLNDLDYLFTAEQARLGRLFDERKDAFLARAQPAARAELVEAIRAAEPRRGPALRRKSLDLADQVARRWLDQWLSEAQPAAEALYVEATRRFADLANDFLAKIAGAYGTVVSGGLHAVMPETGFRVRSRLYYTSLMALTGQSPAGWLLDVLRPRKRQLRALDRQVGEYLDRLIFANAHRIEGDFNDRVLESRRRFQFEIHSALAEIIRSAEQALERAKKRRTDGSAAVAGAVEHIAELGRRLDALDGGGKGRTS